MMKFILSLTYFMIGAQCLRPTLLDEIAGQKQSGNAAVASTGSNATTSGGCCCVDEDISEVACRDYNEYWLAKKVAVTAYFTRPGGRGGIPGRCCWNYRLVCACLTTTCSQSEGGSGNDGCRGTDNARVPQYSPHEAVARAERIRHEATGVRQANDLYTGVVSSGIPLANSIGGPSHFAGVARSSYQNWRKNDTVSD
eukprot:TRINITY_DN83791_c0_g1_i1.p1 TRINITY_DN83791_c0_g1~~TRINITY_DN83791_c0_g1_i1.p1  ORF type:complete len:197 (+),score=3.78 TRINITY_DN83791_c0_g1_i1:46-636(+)